ncbi:MAG: [FeFe] hydrogenase H-cluster radical SAM maturase HydE [Bacteroidales bacterium]|nr:[FeFe] hydrogenase H-cluster radical SAM maturase HydE [Bacteroidales bacterium]MBN2764235.1 [FeFe] hydrogenase H-cluster radical SAM maturase HydE [Bacteroidales bacterium]
MKISEIISKELYDAEGIAFLLKAEDDEKFALFDRAKKVKERYVQNKVYFRALLEFSNYCSKNCFYCGIRKDNRQILRYNLDDDEILTAARFAYENRYGSIVMQSGELESHSFTKRVEYLLRKIRQMSDGRLRVTLCCGEQSYETYRRWYESGANRYLLRIESSNPDLYKRLHPDNAHHRFKVRRRCLDDLKKIGYQVGTGVMIGLPFQTYEDLAGDLLFMKQIDIDMVGMGPYLEHQHTPLYRYRDLLMSKEERLQLSFKMIAVLRLMMKDINIAATTALQAIDPLGREKALQVGANVIMPNITPVQYRDGYILYENKPLPGENVEDSLDFLETSIAQTGNEIAYEEWGDSEHYKKRLKG